MSSLARKKYSFDLTEVKAIPIFDVGRAFGITMQKGMRCPLPDHNDKNSSFAYWTNTNYWECFGCGKKGFVIDFVCEMRKCDVSSAIKFLRTTFLSSGKPLTVTKILKSANASPVKERRNIDSEVYGFIMDRLVITERVESYFSNRCISRETLQKRRIGELPDQNLTLLNILEQFGYDRVMSAGLLSKYSTKDRPQLTNYRDRAFIPFIADGKCEYLQARYVIDKKPRWLNLVDVPRQTYNRDLIYNPSQKEVYICEGITDALTAFEMGLPAVAALGASNVLDSAEVAALRNKDIYVVGDADKRGQEFTQKIRDQLRKEGISSIPQTLPAGCEDLNDYWIKLQVSKGNR